MSLLSVSTLRIPTRALLPHTYDANCNITAISRGGMETEANGIRIDIDDLLLSYSGNQLTRITDNGEDSGEYGVMEFVDRARGVPHF